MFFYSSQKKSIHSIFFTEMVLKSYGRIFNDYSFPEQKYYHLTIRKQYSKEKREMHCPTIVTNLLQREKPAESLPLTQYKQPF